MSVKSWQGVNIHLNCNDIKYWISWNSCSAFREVVGSRKAVNKIYAAKANLNSVQLQMKGQLAQVTFLLNISRSPVLIQFIDTGQNCRRSLKQHWCDEGHAAAGNRFIIFTMFFVIRILGEWQMRPIRWSFPRFRKQWWRCHERWWR